MTRRRLAALLAVPLLLLAAAWALGGAVFDHPPADLGGVVVVRPAADRPSAPAAPSVGPSTRPGEPGTFGPSRPSLGSTAQPAPPTGATRVTNGPVPTAGDDDDDDDGIDDGIDDGGVDGGVDDDDGSTDEGPGP